MRWVSLCVGAVWSIVLCCVCVCVAWSVVLCCVWCVWLGVRFNVMVWPSCVRMCVVWLCACLCECVVCVLVCVVVCAFECERAYEVVCTACTDVHRA